jgi:hypothetical protein
MLHMVVNTHNPESCAFRNEGRKYGRSSTVEQITSPKARATTFLGCEPHADPSVLVLAPRIGGPN